MTDLEDRLSQVLNQRAGTITTAPAYRLVMHDEMLEQRRPASSRPPVSWRVSVIAVAVVVAVVVAVLVTSGIRHRTPVAGRVCQLGRVSGFRAAVRTGRLPAGSTVLSGAANGSELVEVRRAGDAPAVELVAASGAVRQLWTAGPGERVRIVANPSGAIGTVLVAFETEDLATGAVSILVVDQHGVVTTLPSPPPGSAVARGPLRAPLASDDTVTVLEQSRTRPDRQHVVVYWTEFTPWRRTSAGHASRVTQLLDAGGNTVLRRRLADGRVDLHFIDPQYRPRALNPAARAGYSFSSDGTTLTWLVHRGSSYVVRHWRPGEPTPRQQVLPNGFTPVAAEGELVTGQMAGVAGEVVVDPGRGAVAALPHAVRLLRSDGPVAVVSSGPGVDSRVPLHVVTQCRT